jgi:hypothetical protein
MSRENRLKAQYEALKRINSGYGKEDKMEVL